MAKTARAAPAPVEPPAAPPAPALAVAVPVLPEAVSEPVEPDPFDLAFAEAAAAEVEPASIGPATAAVPPKKPAAPKPAEPKPVEPVPAEPVVQEPAPPEPPAQAQPQLPLQPPPQLQPQPQPPPPPPPPPQAYQPPPAEPPLFSAEEAAQLQTFYNDWPDVAKSVETMIRGMLTQTARRMYQDMASSLAPYLHTVDTLADRSQLSELQGQVSDYDTVATQLSSWAARQPAYLRSAYEHVIKSGTAAEVVDLINRFKQDQVPAQAAVTAQAPVAAPAPSPAPVNPALAAAAARLAPVATKRTNVVAPPADFDTAFAEFAKSA